MSKDGRMSQKDLYGFPISLTSSEASERVRCYKKSKKRQARDWAFETANRHIPPYVSHEDMKRRCRKVRFRSCVTALAYVPAHRLSANRMRLHRAFLLSFDLSCGWRYLEPHREKLSLPRLIL